MNYTHEQEMTHQQKVDMYLKLTKAEIIEMLIENQRIIKMLTPVYPYVPQQYYPPVNPHEPYFTNDRTDIREVPCQHVWMSIGHQANGHQECKTCGATKQF